ncbi:transcription elongation factor GreA [Clostridia bacterium]|nr:transcription elongation factor GreA [Clostridia bacterium]
MEDIFTETGEKRTILTEKGHRDLETELRELKGVRRKEVAEKIKEARGQGDLSENAEYDSAKEEQAQIEARIVELENMLKTAKVIEGGASKDTITLGSSVRVLDVELGAEEDYTIVGSAEADPFNGKISNESPLGKALLEKSAEDAEPLGHKVGDIITVDAPDGNIEYKIIDIN